MSDHKPSDPKNRTPYYKPNGDPYTFVTQDSPENRKWTWEEDGYTVVRTHARTGPGCHSNCGVLLYIKDGRVEKVEGDPENPFNQGRLCPRCLAMREILYHPDRLKYPLKRTGRRGENKWERITWDEAYDIIEEKLKGIIAKYGNEAIMVTQGTGRDINGYMCRIGFTLNTPNQTGWLAGNACYVPRLFLVGQKMGTFVVADCSQFFPERYDHPDYERPEYILIWGNNPVYSNSDGFLGHWVVELMKRGTKLITVDPRLTWLASKSEYYFQLRPGTDAALALAMGHVICQEGLYDREFVEKWTYGFEAYRERVKDYSPERAAAICGVDAELIRQAARALGRAKNAALQWGAAIDQVVEPIYTGAALIDLMALTGNIEKPGTMVSATPAFGVKHTWQGGWGAEMLSPEQKAKKLNSNYPYSQRTGSTNVATIRETMLTGKPYPIKACWMQTTNPLSNSAMDPKGALEALQKMEFNVVVDLFMTATALAVADIVLPAACYAERPGLCGHHPYFLGAIAQAVEPLGECHSDQQIIYDLCRRFRPEEHPWINDLQLYDYILEPLGITYEDMKLRTWAYPPFTYHKHEKGLLRPDKKPGFDTPSGKYEFVNRTLADAGLDPLPAYYEPFTSPRSTPERAEKYPLTLISGARRPEYFLSEHRQSPSLRRMHPNPTATIHAEDAKKYGIADGDWIWVENDHGRIRMQAEVTLAIKPNVVNVDNGWWFPERDPEDGTYFGTFESNANVLMTLQNGMTGMGCTIKAELCRIYKAGEDGES